MHRQAVAALVLALNAATLGSAPASACSEHRSYYDSLLPSAIAAASRARAQQKAEVHHVA